MKNILLFAALLSLSACGFTSKDNEASGQVKKVISVTPLVCGDYTIADISLGVMRNGVGSMSTEDVHVVVADQSQIKVLKEAADQGKVVKFTFDVKRLVWCTPDHVLKTVEVVE